jgi:hypothetical protein
MRTPNTTEPVPCSGFLVNWGNQQIAAVTSVSALRLGSGDDGVMQPDLPVEFARACTSDDAFESWAADPGPRTITVTVLSAGGLPALVFLIENAVPVSYVVLDGLDADSTQMATERLLVRCQGIRRVSH